jgi:hypothetical protein
MRVLLNSLCPRSDAGHVIREADHCYACGASDVTREPVITPDQRAGLEKLRARVRAERREGLRDAC